MIIAINVPKEHVDNAIQAASIGYWGHRVFVADSGLIIEEHHEEQDPTKHTPHPLTPKSIEKGLELMIESKNAGYHEAFSRILRNWADGADGDLLIQLAIFGEEKYS